MKRYEENSAWRSEPPSFEAKETAALAVSHIGAHTLMLSRQYVRCYELLECGFYSEAFIVAFSILDDFVQGMLDHLLLAKGLHAEADRKFLLRGIKDNRLTIYLGPLLKLACGRDLFELWPHGRKALEWLNGKRNGIAHNGAVVDFAGAAKGIFGCLRILVTLKENNIAAVDLTPELFRHAKITAAWTASPPEWVPQGEVSESNDFRC